MRIPQYQIWVLAVFLATWATFRNHIWGHLLPLSHDPQVRFWNLRVGFCSNRTKSTVCHVQVRSGFHVFLTAITDEQSTAIALHAILLLYFPFPSACIASHSELKICANYLMRLQMRDYKLNLLTKPWTWRSNVWNKRLFTEVVYREIYHKEGYLPQRRSITSWANVCHLQQH